MLYIDIRQDGWFEAGKDAKKTFPFSVSGIQVETEAKGST